MPIEEQSEKPNDKKDPTTKQQITSIFSLKNQIQSVVTANEDDNFENFGEDKNFKNSPGALENHDQITMESQQLDTKPRAIDQFLSIQQEKHVQEDVFFQENDDEFNSDIEEIGDILKGYNQGTKKRRIAAKGNQQELMHDSPKKKTNPKHFEYLEKLRIKRIEEEQKKANLAEKAIKQRESLKQQVLTRCKELTKTRTIDDVSKLQSEIHNFHPNLSKTQGYQNQKKFVIKRLKSSQGADTRQASKSRRETSQTQINSSTGKRLAPILNKLNLDTSISASNKNNNLKTEGSLGRRKNNKKSMAKSLAPIALKKNKDKSANDILQDESNQSISINQIQKVKTNKKSKSISKNTQEVAPVLKNYTFITSVEEWLKKNRLPPDTKVFIISQGYSCIQKALIARGWVQNPNYLSTCFHFKFTLRGSHIGFESLSKNQIVNHFEKVSVLTTKIGLTRTMNHLHLHTNVDQDSFFPRSYDCNEEMEFESFCMYFKQLEAECILKNFLDLALKGEKDSEQYQMYNANEAIQVRVALVVCRRRLMHLGQMIDSGKDWVEVTDKEWEVLSRGSKTQDQIKQMIFDKNVKRYENLAIKENEGKNNGKKVKKNKKRLNIANQKNSTIQEQSGDEDEEGSMEEQKLTPLEQECKYLISRLEKKYPQTRMNGKKNIWIVKPAGLSRGRGIELFSSFHEIYHHLKTRDFSWVIQKYLENPLCYKNKKMDIRQWILVTDWNPLTIWFYQECYIRLSTNDFSLANIKNRFTHLTNNSVNKKSDNFVQEEGFATQDQFSAYVDSAYGQGSWKKIVKQMKMQVKWSLQCAQNTVVNRKNSGEIFGYDFCIDEDLKVWLIEVNASPDFSYSSSVTENLVKRVSEDFVKVMIDHRFASKKDQNTIDTGMFKRTYRSNYHENTKEALGLTFECVGKKIDTDRFQRFFQQEDKAFKQNYEVWLEEHQKLFNHGSDDDCPIIEENGDEISKVEIIDSKQEGNIKIEPIEEIKIVQKDIVDKKEQEDSDGDSF